MAWLRDQQPAAQKVQVILNAAYSHDCTLLMSIVNVGEVLYLSTKAKNRTYAETVVENLRRRMVFVSANDDLVMFAAALKAKNPISYADAFAAATAITQRLPLVTGDPELRALARKDKALKLEWLGA